MDSNLEILDCSHDCDNNSENDLTFELEPLDANETVMITIESELKKTPTDKNIITYIENIEDGSEGFDGTSNKIEYEIPEADINIITSQDKETINPGEVVTFTIKVQNLGTIISEDIKVEVELDKSFSILLSSCKEGYGTTAICNIGNQR